MGSTSIREPQAALTAIELDSSLCQLEQINFLTSLSSEQVKAWKMTKIRGKEGEQISISELSHIQNPYQVRILNYLLERNSFRQTHLEDLKFINSRLLEEAYVFLMDHSEHAPEAFWEKISNIDRNWDRSPTFVIESMKLLKSRLNKIHPYLWDLMPNWNNQNSLQSLKALLAVDAIKETLSAWSLDDAEIADLDAQVHELLLQSLKANSREQMQAFQYYCSLQSDDPFLKLEKQILTLLGFEPQMLEGINTSTKLGGLILITKQYSAFMRKKRPNDFETFPWEKVIKPFPFDRLNELNSNQLNAIEASVEKKKNIPSLNEFPYIDNQYKLEAFREALEVRKKLDPAVYESISSYLDVELFSLCLKHQTNPNDTMLFESFKRIPYRFRSFSKQILTDVFARKNPELNQTLLNLLTQTSSMSSIRMIKYLLDNGKEESLAEWVLKVDDETKFNVVRICFEKFEDLPLSELSLLLPQITNHDNLILLEAVIAKGLDLRESFEKVRFSTSLGEKINTLGLTHQYWTLQLDSLLKEVPDIIGDGERDENSQIEGLDPQFEEFLQTYRESEKVRKLLNAGYLAFCKTTSCPGLTLASGDEDRYCSACDEAFCGRCGLHAHAGGCQEFSGNGHKVDSRQYPGAANFRKGLRNVCFFNSLMKLMTQLASTVPEFKEFLDPKIDSEAFVKAGEHASTEYNGQRKKLKHALYRWIDHALRGCDLHDDNLAELSNEVMEPLGALLELEPGLISGVLNQDQLDSQEILSYLLSKLGFEFTDFAMKMDEETSLAEVNYTNHNQDLYSLLNVPIAGQNDLGQAVDKIWEPETLDQDNWYRHDDGEKYETVKTRRLVSRPKLLFISQKRYVQEMGIFGREMILKKLTHSVKVSESLRIPRFDSENLSEPAEELEYELVALTLHKGSRIEAGHYIAYTVEPGPYTEESQRFGFISKKKEFPYQFVIHDDAKVKELTSMSAASNTADHEAYLLAYKLKELDN
ncbi:MAG: hypothetical protein HRU09_11410 [Oligoflexales bacterium]|nr:hypothetical protein [Oligoflexales bacterium]